MFLLPALLAWAVLAYDRYGRRRWSPDARPAEAWPLLAVSIVGVVSHPFLDWLNNYGIRLLMPFDGRWFYGDAVFIVDPWLWLLLGGAVMLAWTRHRPGAVLWAVIGIGTSALVLSVAVVPGWAKLVWIGAVAVLLALRWAVAERFLTRTAIVSLVLATAYIATMIVGSRVAEREVRELARARGWDVDRVAAMPVPADPFRRQVIAVTPHAYFFVPVNWTRGLDATSQPTEVSRGTYDEVVAAALEAPSVRGVRGWLRFPSYEIQPRRDGTYRVIIRDARFAVGNQPGFGVVAMVDLDAHLAPLTAPAR
jgi:inner membrane protein